MKMVAWFSKSSVGIQLQVCLVFQEISRGKFLLWDFTSFQIFTISVFDLNFSTLTYFKKSLEGSFSWRDIALFQIVVFIVQNFYFPTLIGYYLFQGKLQELRYKWGMGFTSGLNYSFFQRDFRFLILTKQVILILIIQWFIMACWVLGRSGRCLAPFNAFLLCKFPFLLR